MAEENSFVFIKDADSSDSKNNTRPSCWSAIEDVSIWNPVEAVVSARVNPVPVSFESVCPKAPVKPMNTSKLSASFGSLPPSTNVSSSVAELFPGTVSNTPPGTDVVTVFESVWELAPASIVAETVYTTEPPFGKFTDSLMSPLPFAVPVAPPKKPAVQVTPVSAAGIESTTETPFAASGPLFCTTIV